MTDDQSGMTPMTSAACCSFCQTDARYEVGTETTFQCACRRHLARAVDWLWSESPDQWFKVTLLTEGVRDGE